MPSRVATTSEHLVSDEALSELRDGLEILALRRLGDRAAALDATQETVVRVLTAARLGRVPVQASLGAYAYGVLRHVIADLRRVAGRELSLLEEHEVPSAQLNPLEQLIGEEERARVRAALTQLSRADQVLLQSCFGEGLRLSEIARQAGEPEGRVRVRKLRALQRLRRLIIGNEMDSAATEE